MTEQAAIEPSASRETRPLVEVEGLSKTYHIQGGRKRQLHAVDQVTFTIPSGSTFGLVGETGSGKSTTGRLILALEPASSGHVTFDGQRLDQLSREEIRRLRRSMQPVPQDPYSSISPRMRVDQLLSEPFLIHKVASSAEALRSAGDLLDLVGLSRSSLEKYPHEFSGGQRQRLVIARAIALRPKFLVCDEPLSALDVSVQAQIINLLRALQHELDLTYLFISHDLAVVRFLCDIVAVMYLGRLMELGPSSEIFHNAAHPYTHTLIGATPIDDPDKRAVRRHFQVRGETPSVVDAPRGCPYSSRCPRAEDRCRIERPAWREIEPGHHVACHFAPVSAEQLVDRSVPA